MTRRQIVDFSAECTPQDILHKLAQRLCPRDLLEVIKTLPKADFPDSVYVTTTTAGLPEFIVHSVTNFYTEIVKYLIDSGIVSPNFVSKTGDPLIMHAAANTHSMFKLLLSKGANVFVENGIVRNKVTGKTLLQKATSSVRNYIMNVIITDFAKITDIPQLVTFVEWAMSQGNRKFKEMSSMLTYIARAGAITATLRTIVLTNLVDNQHPDLPDYCYWADTLPREIVQNCVDNAANKDSSVAYGNIIRALKK